MVAEQVYDDLRGPHKGEIEGHHDPSSGGKEKKLGRQMNNDGCAPERPGSSHAVAAAPRAALLALLDVFGLRRRQPYEGNSDDEDEDIEFHEAEGGEIEGDGGKGLEFEEVIELNNRQVKELNAGCFEKVDLQVNTSLEQEMEEKVPLKVKVGNEDAENIDDHFLKTDDLEVKEWTLPGDLHDQVVEN